jgi:uncharacterized protein (DUF2147 family)
MRFPLSNYFGDDMKLLNCAAILATSILLTGNAFAQASPADSPVGLWKSIDDETKAPKSLVRISESGGVFSGKIEKLLTAGREDAKCEKCEGDLKDKPVTGMAIITGMKKADDGFEGGSILDPNNGKVYRSKMKLIDGGKKLEVRGYIGPFSRAQIWTRE